MKYSLELIRFIAVLLITFTHTRHNFTEGSTYVILEILPTYGTIILSLVSGYLYYKFSRNSKNLFQKKVQSLFIPYIIANIAVLIPVVLLHYLGYDFLSRLSYNYTLITEGLFSLNYAPINPPTYFIRDLFIVFTLIEVVTRQKYYLLLILVPLMIFGNMMLRYDILLLFILGALYGRYHDKVNKLKISLLLITFAASSFYFHFDYSKYIVALLLFIVLVDIPIQFFNVGGYTYLLHLYHSPILIVLLPIINATVENDYLKVVLQISITLILIYFLYLLTRKFVGLRIISGGR